MLAAKAGSRGEFAYLQVADKPATCGASCIIRLFHPLRRSVLGFTVTMICTYRIQTATMEQVATHKVSYYRAILDVIVEAYRTFFLGSGQPPPVDQSDVRIPVCAQVVEVVGVVRGPQVVGVIEVSRIVDVSGGAVEM